MEKLNVALWSCGGSLDDVEEAIALYNPLSQQAFEAHRLLVATRHITTPSMFNRDHWKKMEEANARADMVAEHERHLSKFEWNDSEPLKVSLRVHGTTTDAGWSMAHGGLGVIHSEGDQGWFGKGIYVFSSLQYAHLYAQHHKKKPALLVCAVAPGNVFPVVDQKHYGQPSVDGYQSHYTVGKEFFVCFRREISEIEYSLVVCIS